MIDDEKLNLILTDVFDLYGYDFSLYSKASLKRRLNRLFILDKFLSFAEFRHKLKSDPYYFNRFIEEITVNVTEMFRDPTFYKVLKNEILPSLGTHPFIRIWHAGCSTGEEVYSMAILLKEAGLLQKSLIYATDLNSSVLIKARGGIFPLSQMQLYSENYIATGGSKDFSSYYTANYDRAIFNADLCEKMIFSTHNLVSDASFNEFHLILCRNVLIYFDQALQEKVFKLFDSSLGKLAYLCLGTKETIRFSKIQNNYVQHGKEKIWRKLK